MLQPSHYLFYGGTLISIPHFFQIEKNWVFPVSRTSEVKSYKKGRAPRKRFELEKSQPKILLNKGFHSTRLNFYYLSAVGSWLKGSGFDSRYCQSFFLRTFCSNFFHSSCFKIKKIKSGVNPKLCSQISCLCLCLAKKTLPLFMELLAPAV